MKIELTLPGLPKTTNASSYNWRADNAERAKWKKRINYYLMLNKLIPENPHKHAKLTLIRYSSSRPDFDGLVSSFKSIIDGLVESGLIENDKPENIGVPTYAWRNAGRKDGKIKVVIEPCRADALKTSTYDQSTEI